MIERFRDGDVVRVVEVGDGSDEASAGVLGGEAFVEGYSGPNEDGSGWNVLVSVEDADSPTGWSVWDLDERQIEATGWRVDHSGNRRTIGLRTAQVRGDEVHLRLATLLTTDAEAKAFEGDVRTSFAALIPEAHIATAVGRRREPDFEIELYTSLSADRGATKLYDTLLSLCKTGWDGDDDGWRRDCIWDRESAAPGEVFIHPAVYYAEVRAERWSDPSRGPTLQE